MKDVRPKATIKCLICDTEDFDLFVLKDKSGKVWALIPCCKDCRGKMSEKICEYKEILKDALERRDSPDFEDRD